jgi:hypothetical protein
MLLHERSATAINVATIEGPRRESPGTSSLNAEYDIVRRSWATRLRTEYAAATTVGFTGSPSR